MRSFSASFAFTPAIVHESAVVFIWPDLFANGEVPEHAPLAVREEAALPKMKSI